MRGRNHIVLQYIEKSFSSDDPEKEMSGLWYLPLFVYWAVFAIISAYYPDWMVSCSLLVSLLISKLNILSLFYVSI